MSPNRSCEEQSGEAISGRDFHALRLAITTSLNPALVIDGVLKVSGKVLKVGKIKDWIK